MAVAKSMGCCFFLFFSFEGWRWSVRKKDEEKKSGWQFSFPLLLAFLLYYVAVYIHTYRGKRPKPFIFSLHLIQWRRRKKQKKIAGVLLKYIPHSLSLALLSLSLVLFIHNPGYMDFHRFFAQREFILLWRSNNKNSSRKQMERKTFAPVINFLCFLLTCWVC